MNMEKSEHSDVHSDESSEQLLEELREKMASPNPSERRQAAFNLSWMQEDGLEILKETLFGDVPKSTKNAAAYGMRKMRGRMKKMVFEAFKEGLDHDDVDTRDVCAVAIRLIEERQERATENQIGNRKVPIREVQRKRKKRRNPRASGSRKRGGRNRRRQKSR